MKLRSYTSGRAVEEWRGKTPDSKVPPHVQLRVLLRYGRICFLSGRPITPRDKFQIHHIKALALDGENRESNLAPVLVEPHKVESARQRADKAKSDHIISKSYGIRKAKHPMPGSRASGFRKRMNGRVERWT